MYCQKCRTPLKLDGSLKGLHPAAYDVLVGSTSHQAKAPVPTMSSSLASPPQPKDRIALYEQASQNAAPPTFRRHGGAPRDSAMSFIYLTESQLVAPTAPAPAAAPAPAPAPLRKTPDPPSAKKTRRPGPAEHDPGRRSLSAPRPPQLPGPDPAVDQQGRLNRLFEILSARSDIDHPICVECSDALVAGLQNRLEDATAERDAYVRFIKEYRSDQNQPTDEELRAQEEALRKARADEADAVATLKALEAEKLAVDADLLGLEEEARELDRQEEQFWRERNAFSARLHEFQSDRDSVNTTYDHDAQQYERLTRSNVHNDTFNISHDGTYGTINGLRLGRLSSTPVDWAEINAAWGHALLLLVVVADRIGHRFVGYEPRPMGSTSKILRLDPAAPAASTGGGASRLLSGALGVVVEGPVAPPGKKTTTLELYSSGDMFEMIRYSRSFNVAMVAFLELVRQLGTVVHDQMMAQGVDLRLPYRIEADKINDISIKLGSEESWTKACKLTLTCCKFLLAHASNVSANERAAAAAVAARTPSGPK